MMMETKLKCFRKHVLATLIYQRGHYSIVRYGNLSGRLRGSRRTLTVTPLAFLRCEEVLLGVFCAAAARARAHSLHEIFG